MGIVLGILDCETTGIGPGHEVIELGILLCEHDSLSVKSAIIDEYCGRREPTKRISPGAKAAHGLSKQDLKGQRLDDARIQALLQRAEILIAHNAAFDRDYIGRHFPDVYKKRWHCSMNGIDWRERGFPLSRTVQAGKGTSYRLASGPSRRRRLPHSV